MSSSQQRADFASISGGGPTANPSNGTAAATAAAGGANSATSHALKHDPGLSFEWSAEELAALEEGLSKEKKRFQLDLCDSKIRFYWKIYVFLSHYFTEVADYSFTADMENEAEQASWNHIRVFKLSNISGKKHEVLPSSSAADDIDIDSDSSSDEDKEGADESAQPNLQLHKMAHHGCINRTRFMTQKPYICAIWGDSGHVQVWNSAPS